MIASLRDISAMQGIAATHLTGQEAKWCNQGYMDNPY